MSKESANCHVTITVWSIPETAGGGTGQEGDAPCDAWPLEHAATTAAAAMTARSRDVVQQTSTSAMLSPQRCPGLGLIECDEDLVGHSAAAEGHDRAPDRMQQISWRPAICFASRETRQAL
jgi:hypothetical protein